MKRIFKNSLLFLDLPQGDILSAGFIIMFLSLISGFFGLIRSRLLATQFSPDLTGIYFAAFVIPDNILNILILSGVGSAFIPVFTKYQKSHEQWVLTRAVLANSLLLFLGIITLGIFFTEPLSLILVPGIQKENPAHIDLLVNLTRIILLAQPFFVLSYVCTGILQSYQRFIFPASAALFYNIGIIVGLLFLAPRFGMYGVAMGIILGAFLHFLIQFPSVVRLGFSFGNVNLFHPGLVEIVKLASPRSLSIAIEGLRVAITTRLASLVSLSSITYVNFANQIAVFPVSLVAAAIAQAALPFLAKSIADNNIDEFKKHMKLSLTHIVFLLAPLSVLLIVFHTPIVRLIFGAPRFSWEATVLTAQTLAILSVGLLAQGTGNILARGFYALFDTKTPLAVTLISTLSSILLGILFIVYLTLDVRSLAVAITIGAIINTASLFFLLHKKVGGLADKAFIKSILKILLISFLLGIFSYLMLKILETYFNTNYVWQLTLFTLLVGAASVFFYFALSFVFNLEELRELFTLFRRAGKVRRRFIKDVFADE